MFPPDWGACNLKRKYCFESPSRVSQREARETKDQILVHVPKCVTYVTLEEVQYLSKRLLLTCWRLDQRCCPDPLYYHFFFPIISTPYNGHSSMSQGSGRIPEPTLLLPQMAHLFSMPCSKYSVLWSPQRQLTGHGILYRWGANE